ncbi:hypothetical protein PHJA_001007500, partial [Phtheirospermum japonicum]
QHDDRAGAGQNGRAFNRSRTDKEHGSWRDSKEHQNDRTEVKKTVVKANPARKRPAFREQKLPAVDPEKIEKTATDTENPKIQERRGVESGRRGRHERPSFARDRELTKGEAWSNGRDRYGGGVRSGYRGREGFNGGQGFHRAAGGRVEKWKHDLYDEANKSPKAKNEEDQISKIEALLAS